MTNERSPRRTREEMLAHYMEKVQKLEAQIAGTYEDDGSNDIIKALKKRLKKTETALRSARITVNGVKSDEGKGWSRAPISEKIEGTRKRLESQIETQNRAEEMVAELPFDVQRLTALVEAAEAGEEVEMPTDLTNLNPKADRAKTDEEVEADFIANEEEANA